MGKKKKNQFDHRAYLLTDPFYINTREYAGVIRFNCNRVRDGKVETFIGDIAIRHNGETIYPQVVLATSKDLAVFASAVHQAMLFASMLPPDGRLPAPTKSDQE